jgi:enoyl-CoA hydratase/carnithine racemase
LPADVRVVVVQGAGRAFSSGLDLTRAGLDLTEGRGEGGLLDEVAGAPESAASPLLESFQEAYAWLRRPDLISIAAVRGYAIGAGFQLALACDWRILAEDARLAMAEIGLGLVPDLGGTKRLVELCGYARALEICVTGRHLCADEADRFGLANAVVPVGDLDHAVRGLVGAVLAAPRDAVIEVKALLAGAALRDFDRQQAAERAAQLRRIADLSGRGE